MLLLKSFPLGVVILIAEICPTSASLMPRTFQKINGFAVDHTRSLARDLRVAFGSFLVSQRSPDTQIYCTPGRPGDQSGSGNSTTSGSPSGTSYNPSSTTRHTTTRSATKSGTSATPTSSTSSPWKLVESHAGNNFYDNWSFFTGSDPTNGLVEYVDYGTAQANGLLEVNAAGHAIMRVETTPSVQNTRQSVRITTQSNYNGGLFVMQAVHMPTGCGVWPAFWTNGPDWPINGEIDIIEGVNEYTNNQATVHTNPGCTLSTSNTKILAVSGSIVGGTNCAALATGNQGCGFRSNSDESFGAAFNNNGGGTYAMQWDSSGIAVYFFPSGSEPEDLLAGAPDPDTWGLAQARWPAAGCDPFEFFKDHSVIFDTTLCGDWAGSAWDGSGTPGQEQSCAQRTGYSTCQSFVAANGAAFQEAYWEIQNVKIYQHD